MNNYNYKLYVKLLYKLINYNVQFHYHQNYLKSTLRISPFNVHFFLADLITSDFILYNIK